MKKINPTEYTYSEIVDMSLKNNISKDQIPVKLHDYLFYIKSTNYIIGVQIELKQFTNYGLAQKCLKDVNHTNRECLAQLNEKNKDMLIYYLLKTLHELNYDSSKVIVSSFE